MRIKKGDKVRIIYGKDKGREGVVERVYKRQRRILIPGLNIYKKHIKKSEKIPQGSLVEVASPIDISKVMIICTRCGKKTRIGFKLTKGKKIRVCKECKSKI